MGTQEYSYQTVRKKLMAQLRRGPPLRPRRKNPSASQAGLF